MKAVGTPELTQRALAEYLLARGAEYVFTVKGNQPTLLDDIRLLLNERIAQRAADFIAETAKPEHGRRERRSIWVSSELNDYLNFPGVAQVFAVRREAALAREPDDGLDAGKRPDADALAKSFAPQPRPLPAVRVERGSLADYDVLLSGSPPQSVPHALAGSGS